MHSTFDLMEEFRQQVVDRAIFSILTKRILGFNEISQPSEGNIPTRISRRAIRVIFEQIISRLNAEVVIHGDHDIAMKNVTSIKLKDVIQRQAINIANYLIDPSSTYCSFKFSW